MVTERKSKTVKHSKPKSLLRFDWALKRILRHKADYKVLEGFLSVLLKENVRIKSISESEANQDGPTDKFNRVDIFVENSNGELLIIEIQNSYEVDYYFRMLYGVSKAITEHINMGDTYEKVRKVYHINIVYFKRGKIGTGRDYVYHGTTEFRGIHYNDVLQLTEKQKKQFTRESIKDLYPEYFILCVDDFDDVAKNSLDEWMFYLKNNTIPDDFTAQGLAEARQRLLFDKLSDREKKAYERFMSQMHYETGVIEDSISEGMDKGVEIGLKKGRAEGKAEREKLEKTITDKDKTIAEERKKSADKDKTIADLKRQLQQAKQNGINTKKRQTKK